MRLSRTLLPGCLAAATIGASLTTAQDAVRVDPRLRPYIAVQGISGSVKSVGSDTMNNLMTLWAEKFAGMYPNVPVEIEGKGSSTAPPALRERAANFGPMSRVMKDAEIDEFESRFGYKPTVVRTAIDMLAVYVHKDNPIARTGLSLQQVDAIFSKTRKGGHADAINTWGDLGLTGEWADKPISLYGRNSASGTYGYFKKHALFKGDYRDSVKEQTGSASVVASIANDRYGIGYSGMGYRTADVAAVPLGKNDKSKPIEASAKNVSDYPLARYLVVYIDHQPGTQLDPLRREFLRLIFSKEGQDVVVKDGFLPVSWEIARQDLEALGIAIDA
jgi:phosphate transport system substrate-binding protein